ncbi:putative triacylglycerol lipase [Ixodes scapularis]
MFCAYTPTMLNAHPSPSKLLTCMDPLIPLEFLLTCVHAYLGIGKSCNQVEEVGTSDHNHESISSLHESGERVHREVDGWPDDSRDSAVKEQSHPEHTGDQRHPVSAELRSKELDSPVQNCGDSVEATRLDLLEQDNAEEHVIFEIPPDSSASLKQKAAGKQSAGKASTSSAKQRAPKTPRNELPWFHANNPQRLKVFEALVSQAADPLLSPYLAPDELLKKLPPAYFLCLHLDPVLDDMVMLAKKLRSLGCSVRIEVLDSLPHGFLNLLPRGKEAQEGMQRCINMLRHALNMELLGCK